MALYFADPAPSFVLMELQGKAATLHIRRWYSEVVLTMGVTYRDHSLPRLSVEAQLLLLQVLTEWGLDVHSNVRNSTGGRVQDK